MRRLAANYIFPVTSSPLKNGIVEIDEQGKIIDIIDTKGKLSESRNLEYYNGIIVPGFINTHCHLELSDLKNVFKEKAGLPSFIQQMIEYRKKSRTGFTLQAIEEADQLMHQSGIVAVGDIVNTNTTIETKQKSNIYYHSFVEVSGLGSDYNQRFTEALKLADDYTQQGLPSSIVPHAPYSVSDELFRLIQHEAINRNTIISIHNQESSDENDMFLYGSGKLIEMLKKAEINLSNWQKSGKSSLQSVLSFLPPDNSILFVHNVYTTTQEIQQINKMLPKSFFVFCPLSNWFIENKLPDIPLFLELSDRITLGTDSLASNKTLSVLDEMKLLAKHYPGIAFQELLQWASLNGAKALKIDHRYGSLEKGKTPGINLISNIDFERMQITRSSDIKRIA